MNKGAVTLDNVYRVARLLESQRVPYVFIGGVALNTWGVPRATFDMDLALAAEPRLIPELLGAFEADGFVRDPVFDKGFRDRLAGMEKIHVHLPTNAVLLRVDLFLVTTPFLKSVLARGESVDLGQGALPICSVADLVLFKLLANRKKDQADLENVVIVQGIPEPEYLERWSETLGISDRLAQLREGRDREA